MLSLIIGGASISALPLSAHENQGEAVDQARLPALVQKTISRHAAGGKVVQVRREDDQDGRWNYEVVVSSNGKEWGFEVDPKGRFMRKHDKLANAE